MTPRKHPLLSITLLIATAFLIPQAKTHAAAGDLYQSSPQNGSIYKYPPAGGVPATFVSAISGLESRIAFNRAGDLFVGDANGIVKITPAGVKSSFATGLKVNGIRCDAAGNVFVSDGLSRSIIKITPAGVKSTFAPAVDTLDLVFDTVGDLYAVHHGADPSNPNGPGINGQGKIYHFKPDGTQTVNKAPLDRPTCMAVDGKGNTFFGNSDGTIYFNNLSCDSEFCFGGGSLYTAGLGNIQSMACDSAGNLFVSTPSGIFKFAYLTKAKTTFSSVGTFAGIAFEPPRALALNIATRLGVEGGENVLIGGFIITDTGGKSVVIRGIGPSLASAGVQGALQDPIIELHYPSGFFNTNDNWKDNQTQASQIQASGLAPTDDREAAFTYNLSPGNYTIVLKGKDNSAGIGLIEVYDIQQSAGRLANISTRGFVGSGDNVMIGGFILGGGNGAARVMIRALGPSLAAAGISNPLQNPTVSLRNAQGAVLASNDDWEVGNATEIYLTGIAPTNGAEAAIVMTLPAGNYTAVVAGLDGGTGVGLVEVYNLN